MGMKNLTFDENWQPHIAVVNKEVYNAHKHRYGDDFLTMAFHKGKVMSVGEYADYHNQGKDTNDRIESIALMNECYEVCPHCETEVMLKTKFEKQICPSCGESIAPCNLCMGNCINPCPLGCV